jgi:hypothetical protein
LDHIYLGVVELNPVLCFLHPILIVETIYQGLIITTLTGKVIQTLIIVDPQSNIPGLIILPTVIGNVESIALESGSHFVEFQLVKRESE